MENRYQNITNDPGFESLVDALAGDRDDQKLEDVVLDMHARVQAQADPGRWLLDRRADYDFAENIGPEDTQWGRLLMEDSRETVEYWLGEMESLRKDINCDALLDMNYGPSIEQTLDWMEQFKAALSVSQNFS